MQGYGCTYRTQRCAYSIDISDAYNDDDVAVEWIKIQLEKVNSFTNVKEKLSIEQLYDLGVQVLNCYGELNVLEFALFCGRLRHGAYEKFFGSVDPMKILMSLDVFMNNELTTGTTISRRLIKQRQRAKMQRRNLLALKSSLRKILVNIRI